MVYSPVIVNMHPSFMSYLDQLVSLSSGNVYLVGGSVRDLLLGIQNIRDIDLLIPSRSGEVARRFSDKIGGSFFVLDEDRQITRVVKSHENETIQFDFADFEGPDLNADLARRDFTVNAMAVDLRDFVHTRTLDNIIDLFHGREDIKQKRVRVVRPDAFENDPLRLLRAVRFAATLGFSIDDETAVRIRYQAAQLKRPSPERIRDELFLILADPNAERNLGLMDGLGLLSPVLPELDPLRGFTPGKYHVHDVFTHCIKTADYVDEILRELSRISPKHSAAVVMHLEEVLEQGVSRKPALRFACLLHDIAKPETFSDKNGHVRFLGHDEVGANKAGSICRRLKLSRNTEKTVVTVIRNHMRLFNLAVSGQPSKHGMYRYCRDLGNSVPDSLILAQADARATYELMPKEKFTDTEQPMSAVLDYYYTTFLKTKKKPLITGQDLIDAGLKPGPRFREILDEIREKQAEGEIKSRKEALEYLKILL